MTPWHGDLFVFAGAAAILQDGTLVGHDLTITPYDSQPYHDHGLPVNYDSCNYNNHCSIQIKNFTL